MSHPVGTQGIEIHDTILRAPTPTMTAELGRELKRRGVDYDGMNRGVQHVAAQKKVQGGGNWSNLRCVDEPPQPIVIEAREEKIEVGKFRTWISSTQLLKILFSWDDVDEDDEDDVKQEKAKVPKHVGLILRFQKEKSTGHATALYLDRPRLVMPTNKDAKDVKAPPVFHAYDFFDPNFGEFRFNVGNSGNNVMKKFVCFLTELHACAYNDMDRLWITRMWYE